MGLSDDIPAWLPVDGSADARILLFLRRADALCSNSYIISTRSCLLVIDPGAHKEQTERIRQVLADELAAKLRPVLLLLTHCHHDHSRSLDYWARQQDIPVTFLAHEAGASAIQSGDSNLTLSYIFSQDFPAIDVNCPVAFTDSRQTALPGGIVLEAVDCGSPYAMKRRVLQLDEELSLDIYQTPGHSPDSLCFRLGRLLFIGDTLLADKPGVAGIPGWSQPLLLETLYFMEVLLAEGGIGICCPGHGAPLNAPEATGLLQGAFKNTQRLSRLVCFDEGRLDFLKTCAVALAREAAVQLAVLGGRLCLAAHRLEELGEEKLARELLCSIDLDAMETFLVQFQDFAAGHDRDCFRAAIPLRGVNMMGRISSLLTKANLPKGIAHSSIRRIELLLRDYINIVAGLDLLDFLEPCDAVMLARNALGTFASPELSEAEIDAAADSPELFGLFLARRLYHVPDCSGIAVRPPAVSLPQVVTEPERLTQLLADCIEQFAALAGRAEVSFSQDKEYVTVGLRSQTGAACLGSEKKLYYASMMELLGGVFIQSSAGEAEQAFFRMPLCA